MSGQEKSRTANWFWFKLADSLRFDLQLPEGSWAQLGWDLVPEVVRLFFGGSAPSMTHSARRVMPNGPVGRKLQHFKCMSKASAYMPIYEVVAEYEPPAPPICLRGALESCLGVYDSG